MGGPSSGFPPKNFLAMPLYDVGPLHPAVGSGRAMSSPDELPRGEAHSVLQAPYEREGAD